MTFSQTIPPIQQGESQMVVTTDYGRPVAKKGSRFSQEDADRLGPELATLCVQSGVAPNELTTDEVYEAAKDAALFPKMHEFVFALDQAEAAREHYLQQARRIVREISFVTFITKGGVTQEWNGPVMLNVQNGDGKRAYVPTATVLTTPSLRDGLVDRAKHALDHWFHTYAVPLGAETLKPTVAAVKAAIEARR